MVSQPDSGEQALEIVEILIRSGAVDIVVVDSVAALVPEGRARTARWAIRTSGLQARLMSQALRKLTGIVSKSKTSLLFINQIRDKIGVMFGSPETTTGGRALKFYASMRLDIRRIGAIKEGEETTGNRTRLRVVKNKVAPPFRSAEFDILYGEGISKEGDLIDLGIAQKIVEKAGSWFSYGEIRLGQGRENARVFLKDNPDLAGEIDRKIRAALGLAKGSADGGGFVRPAAGARSPGRPHPIRPCASSPAPKPSACLEFRGSECKNPRSLPRSLSGSVAQSVERGTENPCVGGSTPSRATRLSAWQGRLVSLTSDARARSLSAAPPPVGIPGPAATLLAVRRRPRPSAEIDERRGEVVVDAWRRSEIAPTAFSYAMTASAGRFSARSAFPGSSARRCPSGAISTAFSK